MTGYVKLKIDETIPAESIVLRLNCEESSFFNDGERLLNLSYESYVEDIINEYWFANKYQGDSSLINSQSKKN